MFNTEGYSLSDIAAVTDNRENDGCFGGGGAWWIIILFLFVFMGWGGNGWGNGNAANSALTRADLCQDMNFSQLENGVRGIQQGLCDGFYTQNTNLLQGFNGIQNSLCQGFYEVNNGIQRGVNTFQQDLNAMNINNMQNTNALQAQLAQCCCDNREAIAQVRYDMATDTCAIKNTIQNSTRDIIDNNNCNTRSILDFLVQDKISTLQAENQNLKLLASQQEQNNYLVNTLRPSPVPAFNVCAPYQFSNCGAYNNNGGYHCGCGC